MKWDFHTHTHTHTYTNTHTHTKLDESFEYRCDCTLVLFSSRSFVVRTLHSLCPPEFSFSESLNHKFSVKLVLEIASELETCVDGPSVL